ncbi:MAG TPA: YMGG-like glycine zipper-containing protein [Vicinamibacterales bacterium]|nr:YMGG-like glycine zipper-containing protein [Vicinamibacterales bacterium]
MTYLAAHARSGRAALLAGAVAVCLVAGDSVTQASAQGLGRSRSNLTGTYQLNTAQSDNPSTIADQAARALPGRERPRLRNQILQRLDAPTEFAIERRGRTITMVSTNADRVTFEANGQAQIDQTANGRSIRTTANLVGDRLEINSTGDRALDYQITIEPINNGRNLRVTRRVSDVGLNQPVISRSVYDRVSTDARLDMYSTGVRNGNGNGNGRYARPRNGVNRAGAGTAAANDVPDGTEIVATLDSRLSTRDAQAEDPFTLTVVSPGQFQGARIDGRLLGVDRSGRVAGRSDITFDFDRIRFRNGRTADFDGVIENVRTPDGDNLHVENTNVGEDESQTSRTATRTGIGAAIGAVIGAVTGGTKGAAIGAAVGGAAGAGSVIVQGRDDLNLEPGSEFRIRALGPR